MATFDELGKISTTPVPQTDVGGFSQLGKPVSAKPDLATSAGLLELAQQKS